MRPGPYIGITGFKHRTQVNAVSLAHTGSRRKLMVGVLASAKTLAGEHNPDGRSPRCEDIAQIFLRGERFLNLVHYYTADHTLLEAQLDAAIRWGGKDCHGLQLNIDWPDPAVLKGFRRSWPGKKLVLQLGGRFRPLTDCSADYLANRAVARYAGLVDYFLLDPSGGTGLQLDPFVLVKYLEALSDIIDEDRWPIGLAVAGGLCADTLHLIDELCMMFHGLSFDAEGKLHGPDGQLDIGKCTRYLSASRGLSL